MKPTDQPLTLNELPARRKNTELVSQLLQDELTSCIETLSPLLTPERAMAKYAGAKMEAGVVEKVYTKFLGSYKEAAGQAFDLARDFDSDWVMNINSRLELTRWEYPYDIKTARGIKTITMTSPRRWVLSYPSGYNLSQMRHAVMGREDRRIDYMRQFVINSLVLQLAIGKAKGLPHLFSALRYELCTEPVAEITQIPLVMITSSIPSFRPPDELILAAVEFSGVPAFIELIDTDAVESWEDPLKVKIQEILTTPT